ncbi:peptide deformylase [candidate division KSB1 bacterium 4572_119]|nr:MAG: peptide deformylase [candidate division KSB1 bacterium 4572_119]
MSKLRVIKYGNPILRLKAKKVEVHDDNIKQLIKNMVEVMGEEEGIGLAAPQVAESIALLVIDHSLIDEEGEPTAYLNPEILTAEGESEMEEGCLSIPDIREEVKRPETITVKYQNVEGQLFEKQVDGLLARVLQHEIDHLNGVLFVDRISSMKKQLLKKKLKSIAAEEKEQMSQMA